MDVRKLPQTLYNATTCISASYNNSGICKYTSASDRFYQFHYNSDVCTLRQHCERCSSIPSVFFIPISLFPATKLLGSLIDRTTLQWRHIERDGVSNHQPHDCLLNRLFRRRSKKTAKLRVTGLLCEGNSSVTDGFPSQNGQWRRHVNKGHWLSVCRESAYAYRII